MGKGVDLCGEGAEEFDGLQAVGVEGVVDVLGEVGADGFGGEGEAGGPFVDEVFGVGEAGVAAGGEVGDELLGGEVVGGEGFGADGPDGCDPGESGALAPEGCHVEPE